VFMLVTLEQWFWNISTPWVACLKTKLYNHS